MKKEEKLPLTFKYLERFSKEFNKDVLKKGTIYYLKSNQIQTDYYVRQRPFKPLVRLL